AYLGSSSPPENLRIRNERPEACNRDPARTPLYSERRRSARKRGTSQANGSSENTRCRQLVATVSNHRRLYRSKACPTFESLLERQLNRSTLSNVSGTPERRSADRFRSL